MAAVSGTVSAVVGAGHSVLDTLSQIHDLFNASDEHERNAAILKATLEEYHRDVRIQLLPDSGTTRQTLMSAESRLKRAEARLSTLEGTHQCNSFICWCWAKVGLMVFPVENALKKVHEDLKNIPSLLKEETESDDRRREAEISTIVYDNNKYVPIEETQAKVIAAIENSDGPPMILLHGGVGKGKSTLARYMCKRYGKSGERSQDFDYVIMVSCGNNSTSDAAIKQYEILESLSATSLTEPSTSESAMAKAGEKIDSKARITKGFRQLLLGKKILMILDGDPDEKFVHTMWQAAQDGKDDKILITSQLSNLCLPFKDYSVLIPMGRATQEEATKILGSLAGLEGKKFPKNIQRYADKMIEATDRNPLALACLASSLSYNQNTKEVRLWQDAWSDFSQLLKSNDTSRVFGQSAESSLWDAMRLSIDSLQSQDPKRILFLMCACKGESVPEEVLRILCAGLKMSSSTFTKSRGELKMKELLNANGHTLGSMMNLDHNQNEELQESPAWSLHSLVKLYMEQYGIGKEEVEAVMGTLLGDDKWQESKTEIVKSETETVDSDEIRLRAALCALYFDGGHADQGVTRAVTRASSVCNLVDSDESMNDLRRKAIEPLIWLLDKRVEEGEWTEMDRRRTRKVLLDFICNRRLESDNVSSLLNLADCPSAQLAILVALTHISSIEEMPLLNESSIGFLQDVVNLMKLKEGIHTRVQLTASQALRAACWKAAYDKSATIVASSSVLDMLVELLANPTGKSPAFAEDAASALMGLAFSNEADVRGIIVNKPGLLKSFLNCLNMQSWPTLQTAVVAALGNLLGGSIDDALTLRVANEEGALSGLVKCLLAHDHPSLQIEAARALAGLAASIDHALELRVANEEGALSGLVKCLLAHDHPSLQTHAAWALKNLAASTDDGLKLRVANEEGALSGLVKCLLAHDHPSLQTQAARALSNLAVSIDDALELRVANEEGALSGLVKCLLAHDHPSLQTAVARALANLAASTDDALKLRVANEEGALSGLVKCLLAHDHPSLQIEAARALSNLAVSTDHALKLRVANEEGALSGLVKCLLAHDHPSLQTHAAGALTNLAASTDHALTLRVANEEGALSGLVKCLLAHDHPSLQTQAARALSNLAVSIDDALELRVANEEGALSGLVKCLLAHDHPSLQTAVARALANLAASTDDALKLRVANEEGALSGLVKCLLAHDHPSLQIEAAWVLANLAASTDDALKLRVANEEGALSGLVKCLLAHDHPSLQTAVARALANLDASTDDALKLRVANEEGALSGLVKCLLAHDHPSLQTQAAWALKNLAASRDDALKLRVANEEGALFGLVKCLLAHDHPSLQTQAAWALKNLVSSTGDALKLRVANEEGALSGLVKCLLAQDHPSLQTPTARVLAGLAASLDHALKLRVANEEGALSGLVKCLSENETPELRRIAAQITTYLARASDARAIIKGTMGLLEGLTILAQDAVHGDNRNRGIEALFVLDPPLAEELGLLSTPVDGQTLSCRICVKAKLGDFPGALDDANEAFKLMDTNRVFILQERGILKRIMGDLDGALADLDEALRLGTDDYEILKHHGYVKFLLNDIEGARIDADLALSFKALKSDSDSYLGGTPVEYLDYKL